jgi:flavin-dependent dehydrogenase
MNCDVAVIGGGPAGATVGALLRKYNPLLRVAIFEAEKFPRDHVGESQLPVVPRILNEMGVWEKVEAANFPVKIGASYRWGALDDDEVWHNYFVPNGDFKDQARPGKYEGQRTFTAFQVDRSVYDQILLDHCRELGCEVYEETTVVQVVHTGDHIDHLIVRSKLDGKEERVTAQYYVDASGAGGLVRRAMDVEAHTPTALRNIAIWDYWQNAEWAEKIGVGGTLVQVMSFGWGWLWFIPLSPTRTSIGLVTSADYYKKSGLTREEIYRKAIEGERRISELVRNAEPENIMQATKDWSFVADRMYGENWFLAGDSCGFADPILAAGMSLAHMGARRVAFSILELLRGEVDGAWIKSEFQRVHSKHIGNHIRFADYWYVANSKFTDLKEYCSQIARDSGLTLDPDEAFQWLGNGGFSEEISGLPFAGTYRVGSIKAFTEKFAGKPASWAFQRCNIFELDLDGASEDVVGIYEAGRVVQVPCYVRDGKTLPNYLFYGIVLQALRKEKEICLLSEHVGFQCRLANIPLSAEVAQITMECLEVMVTEGWVKASYDPSAPMRSAPTAIAR